jgi:CO dehydrogenase/acetyl-CoA synthase alpha subunit
MELGKDKVVVEEVEKEDIVETMKETKGSAMDRAERKRKTAVKREKRMPERRKKREVERRKDHLILKRAKKPRVVRSLLIMPSILGISNFFRLAEKSPERMREELESIRRIVTIMNDTGERFKKKLQMKRLKKEPKKGKKPKDIFQW